MVDFFSKLNTFASKPDRHTPGLTSASWGKRSPNLALFLPALYL
ncbi:hypothetical protein PJF56_21505 [Roseofilum sp. BLCC_M91]|uniref:Uncharacterized protein n=1 Tax=Roseofilum halophilum BLCC-M91 TaxID=3022259 RepID=A0ABT7BQT4_9CYAN|nr:hypothetical protein [Roseofilum halophilum]MDJ1181445.1 hypothetical protein [Roseofilum halophilum BLCC-M91]